MQHFPLQHILHHSQSPHELLTEAVQQAGKRLKMVETRSKKSYAAPTQSSSRKQKASSPNTPAQPSVQPDDSAEPDQSAQKSAKSKSNPKRRAARTSIKAKPTKRHLASKKYLNSKSKDAPEIPSNSEDETAQDEAAQDEAAQDEAAQDETAQDEAAQNETGYDRRHGGAPRPEVRMAQLDLEWRQYLAEHYIEHDDMLHFTRRIFNLLEHNSLRNAPPELSAPERAARHWEALLLPPDQARNTVARVEVKCTASRKQWYLKMYFNQNRTMFLDQSSTGTALPFSLMAETDRAGARRVADAYADILNRWRWDPQANRALFELFFSKAYGDATGHNYKFCNAPKFHFGSAKNISSVTVALAVIDGSDASNTASGFNYYLQPHQIPDNVDLSSIPDPVPGTKWGSLTEYLDTPPSCRPTDRALPKEWTTNKLEAGEKFMQRFASVVHGLKLTRKQLDERFAYHLSAIFGKKSTKRES